MNYPEEEGNELPGRGGNKKDINYPEEEGS